MRPPRRWPRTTSGSRSSDAARCRAGALRGGLSAAVAAAAIAAAPVTTAVPVTAAAPVIAAPAAEAAVAAAEQGPEQEPRQAAHRRLSPRRGPLPSGGRLAVARALVGCAVRVARRALGAGRSEEPV